MQSLSLSLSACSDVPGALLRGGTDQNSERRTYRATGGGTNGSAGGRIGEGYAKNASCDGPPQYERNPLYSYDLSIALLYHLKSAASKAAENANRSFLASTEISLNSDNASTILTAVRSIPTEIPAKAAPPIAREAAPPIGAAIETTALTSSVAEAGGAEAQLQPFTILLFAELSSQLPKIVALTCFETFYKMFPGLILHIVICTT